MNPTPAQLVSRGRSFAILLALALTFLTGCVGPVRVPISSDSRTQLGKVKGIVGLQQQEIGTEINPSNVSAATGGGLIAGIIDMSIDDARAKKAEAAVKPVRDALIDYQPGNVLAADLQNALDDVPGASLSHTDVQQVIDPNTTAEWINGSGGTSVLLVTLGYKLSADFKSIIVSAEVSLHPAGGRLASVTQTKANLPPLVYYNMFSSFNILPGLAGAQSRDGLVTLWAADGGRQAKTVLNAGLQELADMIAYDLTAPSPPAGERYETPDGAEKHFGIAEYGATNVGFQGYIEHKADGRIWVRLPGGQLSSFPQ
ncbi:MAG TPA: hypothetical protein VNV15_09620 [Opitutaceae bacterium]|nr:hypothetical protein [Opitutaceae bacterium]